MAEMRETTLEPKQKAMLAALAVVLLALVYFLFLKGDGGSQEVPPASAPGPALAQTEEDPFEPDPGEAGSQPVETFEVFASRDPFEPVVEGASSDEGNTSGDELAQADGSGNNEGSGNNGTQEPDDPTLGEGEIATGAKANQDEVQGHSVKLIDVFREGGEGRAQVQVDSTGYTVTPDEVFAENFQLVSTSGTCATMLYGDDQFTLCEGEEILK